MTPEFWAIIGVGVSLVVFGLAALQFTFKRMDQGSDDVNKRMDQRFDGLNRRMDQRFDDVNKRMDQRFDGLNRRVDDTNNRVGELTFEFKQMTSRLSEVEKGLAHLQGVLDGLREALFERSRS